MKIKNKILFALGIFLVLDGILSVVASFPQINLNNSFFGQIVRIVRAIIGVYIIYLAVKK